MNQVSSKRGNSSIQGGSAAHPTCSHRVICNLTLAAHTAGT
jgi:hypothetical protein